MPPHSPRRKQSKIEDTASSFLYSLKTRLSGIVLNFNAKKIGIVLFFSLAGFGFFVYMFHPEWIWFNKSGAISLETIEETTEAPPVVGEASCPPPEEMEEEECFIPVIVRVETPKPPKGEKGTVATALGFCSSIFSKAPKKDTYKYNPIPWPKRFTLSHIVGNQGNIDFSSNLSSVGLLFGPDFKCSQFLPLLDLQGHHFDDTTYAATGGFILRYIPSTKSMLQEIMGLNVYYDYRQGSIGYYQQCGVGLEILADRWELRANGYIPFGHKKSIDTCSPSTSDRTTTHNYQNISYGFNAEVGGYCVKMPTFLLYVAAGPYFISGRLSKTNTVGYEARLRPQYKDYIALDLSYNWDPLFRSIYQAEVVLYAPLYQLAKRRSIGDCARGLTLRQIYQNVERFDVMPLGRRTCREP